MDKQPFQNSHGRLTKQLKALQNSRLKLTVMQDSRVADLIYLRDKLNTLTMLTEGNIFDWLMVNLRKYQNKQATVDGKTMAGLRALFKAAKAAHEDEFIHLWVNKLGAGKNLPPSAVVAFFSSPDFQAWVKNKWAEIEGQAVKMVQQGTMDSAELGVYSMQKEIDLVIKHDQGDQFKATGEVAGAAGPNTVGKQVLYPQRFYIDPKVHNVQAIQQILTLMGTDFGNLSMVMVPKVSRTLLEGAQAGEGIKELRKRLMSSYDMGYNRADIIARWAMIRGFNQARLEQYKAAQEILPGLKKVWMAHLDGRTCPYCAALNGTVIADMGGAFDATQTFSNGTKPDGSPTLKFFGDQSMPPRHPRCRCSIVSWRDAWRTGALFSPEDMVQQSKQWAEEHGYAPKTFPATDTPAAQARIDDVKAYLASTSAENMQPKVLKSWLDELYGISKGPDVGKGLKISSSKLAGSVQQALDMVLLRDQASPLQMKDAKAIFSFLEQLKAMKVNAPVAGLKSDLEGLFSKWVAEAEDFTLHQWNIDSLMGEDFKTWADSYSAITKADFFLKQKDGGMLLTNETKNKVLKMEDQAQKAMFSDLNKTLADASASKDPATIKNTVEDLTVKLADIEVDPAFSAVYKKGTEVLNELETLQTSLEHAAKWDNMSITELTAELKAAGASPSEVKYLTKEQKIEALKKGVDDPEVKGWFADSKKKNVEAVKASQAKKKAAKAKVIEQVSYPVEAEDAAPIEPLIAPTPQGSAIPGVYQDLDFDPAKNVQIFTPGAKVVLKNTHGQDMQFTYGFDAKAKFGGQSEKHVLIAQDGSQWMFKVYGTGNSGWPAHAEVGANDIMDALGHASIDIRYVEFNVNGVLKSGSVQRIVQTAGDTAHVLPETLTDAQRKQLQEFQVVDYLLANLDSHSGNFMVMHDGTLMGIDKGQSFKHLIDAGTGGGHDPETLLSLESNSYSTPYYVDLWKGYIAQKYDMDLSSMANFIEKVENLPDQAFREAFDKYADVQAVGDPKAKADFLNRIIDRKHSIRAKLEAFYKDIASKRAVQFDGFPVTTKAIIEDAQAGIHRTVTEEFAKAVQRSEFQGVSYFVSGEAAENNTLLVSQTWREVGGKLEPRLRLTMKLRSSGYDKNLVDLIRQKLGQGMTGPSSISGPVRVGLDKAEHFYEDILEGVKTVAYHNSHADQNYNQDRITRMRAVALKLAQLTKTSKDPEEVNMANHYLKVVKVVEEALKTGDPIPNGVHTEYLYTPKPKAVKAPITAAGQIDIRNIKVEETSRYFAKHMNHPDTGRPITVSLPQRQSFRGGSGTPGTQYRFDYARKYEVEYVPNRVNTFYGNDEFVSAANKIRSQQGRLEVELPWTGKPEEIEEALDDLRKLGIDMSPATRKDMELSYWRQVAGSVRESGLNWEATDSKEHKTTHLADARIKGLMAKLDSDLSHTTDQDEEINRIKQFVADAFGQKAVDNADWTPKFSRLATDPNSGLLAGRAYWYRPDVDTAALIKFTPDQLGMYAGVGGGDDTVIQMLSHSGTMYSTEERARLGMLVDSTNTPPPDVVRATGWSSELDQARGGADYVFTRLGKNGAESNMSYLESHGNYGGHIILSPNVLRRTSTMTYETDVYGRPYIRRQARYLDPKTWQMAADYASNNETDVKAAVSLYDDMEVYFASNAANRKKIIGLFKTRGVTEIRGIPIEERVIDQQALHKSGGSANVYYKEFFAKYQKQIFDR